MVKKESRSKIRAKKHLRIRNRFSGTAERPRLAVRIVDSTGNRLFNENLSNTFPATNIPMFI